MWAATFSQSSGASQKAARGTNSLLELALSTQQLMKQLRHASPPLSKPNLAKKAILVRRRAQRLVYVAPHRIFKGVLDAHDALDGAQNRLSVCLALVLPKVL
mmetsp:Transcript_24868/g.85854  ORF Transcript_24868/g.85854 Transcript_24868/m.85854 type:complete len:102 (+) Transcript_24868:646-951(+)